MSTALQFFGIVALTVLSISTILVALTVFHTSERAFRALDRSHDRWVKQTTDLFDRLMAKNWAELMDIRSFDSEEVGGFYTPEEQTAREEADEDEITQLLPTRWGTLQPSSDIPRPDADEERLLAEDFDDQGEPRRRSG